MSTTCTRLIDCDNKDNWDVLSILKKLVCVDANGNFKIRTNGGGAVANELTQDCLQAGENIIAHGLSHIPYMVQVWHYVIDTMRWEQIWPTIEADDTNIYITETDQLCDGIKINFL